VLYKEYDIVAFGSATTVDLQTVWQNYKKFSPSRFGTDCIGVTFEDNKSIFIFSYGSIVFVNFTDDLFDHHLQSAGLLKATRGKLSLNEEFVEDDFALIINPQSPQKIKFASVTLPSWDIHKIHIICTILAKSSALEIIENNVDQTARTSEDLTRHMSFWSTLLRSTLIKTLLDMLYIRHKTTTQLALLAEPELTWENEEANKIYTELLENFDIVSRLDRIEKILEVSSSVSQLQLDLINVRRSELLEMTIIVLIVLEIFRTF
jgi:required for meiotic nuclear division protein 1